MLSGMRRRLGCLSLSSLVALAVLPGGVQAQVNSTWTVAQPVMTAPVAAYPMTPAPVVQGQVQLPAWNPVPVIQRTGYYPAPCNTAPPCCQPCPQMVPAPTIPQQVTPPATEPKKEEAKEPKKEETTPPVTQPPAPEPNNDLAQAPETGADLGAGGVEVASSNVGYIDEAIPQTQVRLRYESASDSNRPDRAEFFYGACGGPGPNNPMPRINYQQYMAYFEYAPTKNMSASIEVPFRSVQFSFDRDPNSTGLSDIIAGFKYAFIADQDRYLTFQTKVYSPTGDAGKGLGTDHFAVEPGLLAYQALNDRLRIEGELRWWIPISHPTETGENSGVDGQVMRYGIGVSYDVWQSCDKKSRLAPVLEFVGWTVLNGKETNVSPTDPTILTVDQAGGDTIVNGKIGARWSNEHFSVYGGYGTGPDR